jgi:stage II sporulation protein D
MQKKMLLYLLCLILGMLIIPSLLVGAKSEPEIERSKESLKATPNLTISVYLTKEKQVIHLPLEEYIEGVVAAEMPATFHLEALKAQALVARTYIINRLRSGKLEDMKEWGTLGESAHVTDTVLHQTFLTQSELKKMWGDQFEKHLSRIKQAVSETEGEVITYQGEPIYAAFFSTSNGKTENAEEYFGKAFPYLKSVSSEWDQVSPKYQQQKIILWNDLLKQLARIRPLPLSLQPDPQSIRVLGYTSGGRVSKVKIGNQTYTGREIREALGLASNDFRYQIQGNKVIFTTYGYGHGVGLSQWGANLLAQRGKKVTEIIQHYYQGVSITNQDDQLAKMTIK